MPSLMNAEGVGGCCVRSHLRVQRLMHTNGIKARSKRKFVVTTDSKHDLPIAENLLARDFLPSAPDRVWSSDITYIATDEGWLYLAVVIDLFSRQVVGWSMQPHMQASLVTDALRMAWFRRHPPPGLIFHSDRGCQYCSHAFQDALTSYGMLSSMSRKGYLMDSARLPYRLQSPTQTTPCRSLTAAESFLGVIPR
jgi:putative transposase